MAATGLGLPLLNPFLQQNASFKNGVNFAVAGATALDISFLASKGVQVPHIIAPFSGQLKWFRTYLGSVCSTPTECSNKLNNALVILGDIGSNDIGFAIGQNKTIQEIQGYVPLIPEAIANATREIIRLGGTQVIVPATFPLGCLIINLSVFPDGDKDDLGCLRSLNNLSIYFNNLLQQALTSLRNEFPQAVIIYADYYSAFEFILRNGPVLGFSSTLLSKTCCGIRGLYNFDRNRACGSPGVPVCPNPAQYIQWDGNHFTQAAHCHITAYLVTDILEAFKCSY